VAAVSNAELKQRLAAILVADVVGYSRLMSLDERPTVAALDAAREVFRVHIESSQGRVIDMAGDSVLAVFETASGAVSAALAVQAQLGKLGADLPEVSRMRFRIGMHLGDVIEKADGTVYGDIRYLWLSEPPMTSLSCCSVQLALGCAVTFTCASAQGASAGAAESRHCATRWRTCWPVRSPRRL
jgi:hypothetical protein